jgi:mono/diheme cytochrome c family protein
MARGESGSAPRAPSRASRFRLFLIAALLLVVVLFAAAYWIFRPNLTSAERGRRLAEANGCFGCHGPEGLRGSANPGREEGVVPNFEGTLMMYAHSEQEVREWIRDGAPREKREDPAWRAERAKGVVRMPAYGRRLSEREIEQLVAFVMAVGALRAPEDSLALHGRDRAEALGCFGCHGAGGRLARPNPGSLKGYVPSWDGPDFLELVSGEDEFREWVEEGVGQRFRTNPVAQFFLKRAPLKMPAYRDHLEPGDMKALWAYVQWLRAPGPASTTLSAAP